MSKKAKSYYKGFWEDGHGFMYAKPDYEDGQRLKYYYQEGKTYEMPEADINLCSEGFHFSTNIEDLLVYYPRLENMVIHRVKPDGRVILDKKMNKGVCSKITILERVQIPKDIISSEGIYNSHELYETYGVADSKYISGGKGIYLAENILNSEGVATSRYVYYSSTTEMSTAIQKSRAIYHCDRILDSDAVSQSKDVRFSRAIDMSKGISHCFACVKVVGGDQCYNSYNSFYIRDCLNAEYLIMSNGIRNDNYYIFNKKVNERRFEIVYKRLMDYQNTGEDIHPTFLQLCNNKWIVDVLPIRQSYWNLFKNSKGLFNILKRLKEFDWEIFTTITGLDEDNMKECING